MGSYKKPGWIKAFWIADIWKERRSILRSLWYISKHRLDNRWRDLRASALGACNASTWDGESYAGGYSHWRCGKRRGHLTALGSFGGEPHRYINYIWEGNGHRVEYAPLPVRNADDTGWFDIDAVIPFRKHTQNRHMMPTARRARQQSRIAERALEKRRAARTNQAL